MSKFLRLSKLMTQQGICSRREADRFISKGFVSVNGVVVSLLGSKVPEDAIILLHVEAIKEMKKKITVLLNKPVGYVSSQPEDGYRAAIELVQSRFQDPQDNQPSIAIKNSRGLAPAGRLDIDSKGLLVLTQDGRIAKKLIGHSSSIQKEYLVWLNTSVSEEKLKLLCHGLTLDGRTLKPATVTRVKNNLLTFVLTEGRKRQIRRMCDSVGVTVTSLTRVRIGNVKLGRLKEGHWRFLKDNEHF